MFRISFANSSTENFNDDQNFHKRNFEIFVFLFLFYVSFLSFFYVFFFFQISHYRKFFFFDFAQIFNTFTKYSQLIFMMCVRCWFVFENFEFVIWFVLFIEICYHEWFVSTWFCFTVCWIRIFKKYNLFKEIFLLFDVDVISFFHFLFRFFNTFDNIFAKFFTSCHVILNVRNHFFKR